MSEKLRNLSLLEARKQLLTAEAEVHRQLLQQDAQKIRKEVNVLADHALSAGALASAVLVGIAALPMLGKSPAKSSSARPRGLFQRIYQWVRWGTGAWMAFKSVKR